MTLKIELNNRCKRRRTSQNALKDCETQFPENRLGINKLGRIKQNLCLKL